MDLYCARALQPLLAASSFSPQDQISAALDGLPTELLAAAIAPFLDGFDLAQLTLVNTQLRRELRRLPQLWTQRMLAAPASDLHHALVDPLQRYVEDTSLAFRGQDLASAKRGDRCACVPVERAQPQPRVTHHLQQRRLGQQLNAGTNSSFANSHLPPLPFAPQPVDRFSLDVWISLLPNDDDASVLIGGIVLGAQSVQWIHPMVWAHCHEQFVLVDTQRNLYCSVLNGPKPIVKASLELERWYHVALTYGSEEQRVYVDGELVHTDEGELHREWPRLEHVQLGTGCISGASRGKPTPSFCGWYGFHGLVDEFRVWDHALSAHEIARLAQGLAPSTLPCYALKDEDEIDYCGAVVEVRCARPREKYTTSLVRLESSSVSNVVVETSFWDFLEWPLFFEDPPAATSPSASKKRTSRRAARMVGLAGRC